MFDKRLKIFVLLIALVLLVFLLRLGQMQLQKDSYYQDKIAELKLRKGRHWQFKTVRGTILDRNGKVLAGDEPKFQLCINYELSCFMDQRVRRAKLLRVAEKADADVALSDVQKELEAGIGDLKDIIEKCARFDPEGADIVNKIKQINDRIWN